MPHLEVSGARLFYELAGLGRPAFVFVHGGLCSHQDWAEQVRRLADDATVLTLDLRAHGRSTGDPAGCSIERWAADLHELIAALGLAPVVLTGHSLASRVVAEAAWRYPGDVSALVLLDGSRTHGGHATSAPPPATAGAPAEVLTWSLILDRTIGPYADADTRAGIVRSMSSASPELMDATVSAMREWDLGRADMVFAALGAGLPTLAIQSTYHDRFVPRHSLRHDTRTTPYLDFLRQAHRGVQIEILAEVGHFSMLEQPDRVTSLIKTFAAANRGADQP